VPYTGIAISGTTAYAVGCGGSRVLHTFSTTSTSPTFVGPLETGAGDTMWIADITISGGTLFGWDETADVPVTIDTASAAVTTIGPTVDSFGDGMAADASGTIYFVPEGPTGPLYTVNPSNGQVTQAATLSGSSRSVINSMTFHNGVLYGVASDSGGPGAMSDLVTIDTSSGVVSTVGQVPGSIDALASTSP